MTHVVISMKRGHSKRPSKTNFEYNGAVLFCHYCIPHNMMFYILVRFIHALYTFKTRTNPLNVWLFDISITGDSTSVLSRGLNLRLFYSSITTQPCKLPWCLHHQNDLPAKRHRHHCRKNILFYWKKCQKQSELLMAKSLSPADNRD